MHAMLKREVCGVDASARFDRSDYGLSYGVPRFSPEVKLQIQAEAIRAD
jgi:polyisoprenoid-binding protein YceI